MKYDFTTILDRHGKDAIAVDLVGAPGSGYPAPKEGFDVIPMWVADMNFPVLPTIQEAMIQRAKHPTFGYFTPRQEYLDAIIQWQKNQNGADVTPENIGYENGVLGGVVTALNVYCSRGDKVLLQSPTYVGFTGSLKNNGYDIVHSPLVKDAQGIWRMDFEDMEKKILENKIHAAIFCSPHNPCGRVWEQWEVEKAMELYKKHDVMVISDEIWSDIIRPGVKHVPTQSVSEDARMRTVAMYAPSKTFNLAGLQNAFVILPDEAIRQKYDAFTGTLCCGGGPSVGYVAAAAAYTGGAPWLESLLERVDENYQALCAEFNDRLPEAVISPLEGTYLVWIDLRNCLNPEQTKFIVQEVCGLAVDYGDWFGGDKFKGFIRLNLATSLDNVMLATSRLLAALTD